ncbi:hypothetical protein OG21DRAFT_1605794 [Imleria badia]|nr:hypothetical protein OG21DRAFT_1605794 [Imleria badia]
MELFRPSIAERQWDGAGVLPKTVIRIVVQARCTLTRSELSIAISTQQFSLHTWAQYGNPVVTVGLPTTMNPTPCMCEGQFNIQTARWIVEARRKIGCLTYCRNEHGYNTLESAQNPRSSSPYHRQRTLLSVMRSTIHANMYEVRARFTRQVSAVKAYGDEGQHSDISVIFLLRRYTWSQANVLGVRAAFQGRPTLVTRLLLMVGPVDPLDQLTDPEHDGKPFPQLASTTTVKWKAVNLDGTGYAISESPRRRTVIRPLLVSLTGQLVFRQQYPSKEILVCDRFFAGFKDITAFKGSSGMSSNLVTLAWGAGLIGLAIAGSMYGASLAQTTYYAWYFSNDPTPIKLLVLLVFVADTLHMMGTTQFYWSMLVLCRRSDAAMCEAGLSWGSSISFPMNYVITFAVQSFYCHRVWIITEKKRVVTMAVLLLAVLQLALGTWVNIETIKHGNIYFVYTSPIVPIASVVSAVCDIIITGTIFKYLWRSELRGRSHVIRDLVVVFINMGVLTCLVSITIGVVYLSQGDTYWIGAPDVINSRCYVNSLLAVLNARRQIRELCSLEYGWQLVESKAVMRVTFNKKSHRGRHHPSVDIIPTILNVALEHIGERDPRAVS